IRNKLVHKVLPSLRIRNALAHRRFPRRFRRIVMRKRPAMLLVVAFTLTLVPIAAVAQDLGGIAGVVRDASGAVMPGVTVEAASPALIEKVRSTVTDGQGQYKIIDLRPGVYSVTFTLTGFTTF